MFKNKNIPIVLLSLALLLGVYLKSVKKQPVYTEKVLASREFSMENRYGVKSVSEVFRDNILLNLAYLRRIAKPSKVDWNSVEKPFTYDLVLKPGEVFAFHDKVLPKFEEKNVKTTNAHFNSMEGFKSDGYLVGDGVCHLASLMSWVAKDARLDVLAPTNHDFAAISEVPKEQGVAIYNSPNDFYTSAIQNLYITNNREKPVVFRFEYNGEELKIAVVEKTV